MSAPAAPAAGWKGRGGPGVDTEPGTPQPPSGPGTSSPMQVGESSLEEILGFPGVYNSSHHVPAPILSSLLPPCEVQELSLGCGPGPLAAAFTEARTSGKA